MWAGFGLSSSSWGGGTAGLRLDGPQRLPLLLLGEKSVQLVMEYVPLGSLRDYLPRHCVGLAQLLLFAQQICEVGWPTLPTELPLPPWPGLTVPSLCLPLGRLSSILVPSAHHWATTPVAGSPTA